MRKIIVLLLLLSILFISSGQTYEQQSIIPTLQKWFPNKPFESLLMKFEFPYWGIKVSIEERGYYYFVEFLIRKSAHFFIFAFIAVAVYSTLPKLKFRLQIAAFITLILAFLDEFHQYLTGGRTPSLQDVVLDMFGALTALLVIYILKLITAKTSSSRNK
ncbi:VanZ family protein [Sporosarcina sp. FA9]|uniref:VanZ family protein n=1 Tax=Sporosarcina sp. FA9 TaxID=3413030 RepID=UPI003F65D31E